MQPLTVGAIIRRAWYIFKTRPWFFMGILVVQFVAVTLVNVATGVGGGIATSSGAPSIFVGTITAAINILFQSFIGAGLLSMFIRATRETAALQVGDLFACYRPLPSYIAAYLLYTIIVIVGSICFIVPGVMASVTFLFAPYLVIERGLGPIAALKESARMTKGNRWRLLALMGASALIMLLGALALIIGLFVAIPVVALTSASFYRALADKAPETPPTALTVGEVVLVLAGLLLPLLIIAGIVASIVFASLDSARHKSQDALARMNLQMTQLGLELYYDQHQAFPNSLGQLSTGSADSVMTGTDTFAGFTYIATPDHQNYSLCTPPAGNEAPECITADTDTSSLR